MIKFSRTYLLLRILRRTACMIVSRLNFWEASILCLYVRYTYMSSGVNALDEWTGKDVMIVERKHKHLHEGENNKKNKDRIEWKEK